MGFSRQEYWSGLPFSPPGDLSHPGIKPTPLASPALVGRLFTTKKQIQSMSESDTLSSSKNFAPQTTYIIPDPKRWQHPAEYLRTEYFTSTWFPAFMKHAVDYVSIPHLVSSLVAQRLKRLPATQETWVRSLGWEDPLEKEMAPHSSILAWRIPWMEEPGRLQSTGSQRVGHDWATSLYLIYFINGWVWLSYFF